MKTLKLSLIAILAIFATACSDDDPIYYAPAADNTITGIASRNPDFSILVQALVRTDLAATLQGSGPFTVFAPTNAAFTTFLDGANIDDVPTSALKEILLNHVVSGAVVSGDLTTGYVKTLAKGSASSTNTLSMFVDTSSGVKLNGISNVTTPDILATNGVIHVVDAVIGLPTVVDHALANPNFSTLVAALTYNPSSGFVGILSGTTSSPFTVFAPTNAAFTSFLTETGYSGLANIPANVLENTLKYHVVAGANVTAADLTDEQVVTTFQGQNFVVDLTGGAKIIDSNNRVSNIIATDVQCSNGIVHVLDKVLLPSF
jgi:uncharacterized surface protein with fasciclin (FAS1) repeats